MKAKGGVVIHGVSMDSMPVDKSELSTPAKGPLKALAKQSQRESIPKGLGRSVAKKMTYSEKARLRPPK